MTLSEINRLLEAQKQPRTVEGLCQLASAMALVSIALDLEIISRHIGEISEHTGSISSDLDFIERKI